MSNSQFDLLFNEYKQETDYSQKLVKFKAVKAAAKTFQDWIILFQEKYQEALDLYPHEEDDDLLGQTCDLARTIYLTSALEKATTKNECQQILGYCMKRNVDLINMVNKKMQTLS